MNTYNVYDGTGYRVGTVEAFDNEGAEKAADAQYGTGHTVEIAYVNLGGRSVSIEAYMSM